MPPIRYISAKLAQEIDAHLMGPKGAFSLDQLMELAGLACATALGKTWPVSSKTRRVLACCGPGNQGGDGLVAARHLHHFGYEPTIYLPKPGKNPFYQSLQTQARNLGIPIISTVAELQDALTRSDIVLDAIFGFSFQPPLREPFTEVLPLLAETQIPIFSVDIPSGWDVSDGPQADCPTLRPHSLISLTAPKAGVRFFGGKGMPEGGKHWLGGRFVPPSLDKEHQLNLPAYPGVEQVVEIEALGEPWSSRQGQASRGR